MTHWSSKMQEINKIKNNFMCFFFNELQHWNKCYWIEICDFQMPKKASNYLFHKNYGHEKFKGQVLTGPTVRSLVEIIMWKQFRPTHWGFNNGFLVINREITSHNEHFQMGKANYNSTNNLLCLSSFTSAKKR